MKDTKTLKTEVNDMDEDTFNCTENKESFKKDDEMTKVVIPNVITSG